MNAVLVRYAAMATSIAVGIAFAFAILAAGEKTAVGVAVGGVIMSLDLIAIVILAGKLTMSTEAGGGGVLGLVFVLMAKLALVGLVLGWCILTLNVDALGVAIGIAAAILGLTPGVHYASRSPEGRAAIKADERRIAERPRDEETDA